MKSKKIEKGSEEFEMIMSWWKFRQKFYEAENDDDWVVILDESSKFIKQYNGKEIKNFAKQLVLAHTSDLEERFRKENGIKKADL